MLKSITLPKAMSSNHSLPTAPTWLILVEEVVPQLALA
jgi:hypothetical protein